MAAILNTITAYSSIFMSLSVRSPSSFLLPTFLLLSYSSFSVFASCFFFPLYKSSTISPILSRFLLLLPFENPKIRFSPPSSARSLKRMEKTSGNTDLSSGDGFESDNSAMGTSISVEVMVAVVIFLFMVIIFVFFLYLYAKNTSIIARRRAQLIFAASEAPVPSRGLDASVLLSLPVIFYNKSDFKDGLECSVCLCELSDGEKTRLLPKCNHGFHLQCIDMWLHSHSTCPLCRCTVGSEAATAAGDDNEVPSLTSDGAEEAEPQPESPAFPTNILFWGNQDQVNSRSSANSARNLAITLPNRMVGGFSSPTSPLPSSRLPSANIKSPSEEARSPGTSKLKSLRRLWSRGKRTIDSTCSSPMGGDIEQGFGCSIGEGSSNFP